MVMITVEDVNTLTGARTRTSVDGRGLISNHVEANREKRFRNGYKKLIQLTMRYGDYRANAFDYAANRKISAGRLKKPHMNGQICDKRMSFSVAVCEEHIVFSGKKGRVTYPPLRMIKVDNHHTEVAIKKQNLKGIGDDTMVTVDIYLIENVEKNSGRVGCLHNLYKTFDSKDSAETAAEAVYAATGAAGLFGMAPLVESFVSKSVVDYVAADQQVDKADMAASLRLIQEPLQEMMENLPEILKKRKTYQSNFADRSALTTGVKAGFLLALLEEADEGNRMLICEKLEAYLDGEKDNENKLTRTIKKGVTGAAGVGLEAGSAQNYFEV